MGLIALWGAGVLLATVFLIVRVSALLQATSPAAQVERESAYLASMGSVVSSDRGEASRPPSDTASSAVYVLPAAPAERRALRRRVVPSYVPQDVQ